MDIFDLENSFEQDDKETFRKNLLDLFCRIEDGQPVLGGTAINSQNHGFHSKQFLLNGNSPFCENQKAIQKLAEIITKFLCDPNLKVSHKDFQQLVYHKTLLSDLFYVSDYENMDHILVARGLWTAERGFNLKDDRDIYYLLTCWNLNSRIDLPFAFLIEKIPETMVMMLSAALYCHEQFFTNQAYDSFNSVISAFMEIPKTTNIHSALPYLINIWMTCTYWDTPQRHSLKQKINELIEFHFRSLEPNVKRSIDKKSPRIAILMEKYTSNHAMYRCYHRPISELKKNYTTCLFAVETDFDKTSQNDFDEFIPVDGSLNNLQQVINQIENFEADIILYPSLGMSFWTVPLANLRLAPIQIMAYGHPASAMSPSIDFGVLVGHTKGPDYQSFCQERLIQLFDEHLDFAPHPETDFSMRSVLSSDGIIRIAINSSLMKVSDRVLRVCQLIAQSCDHFIEFHFFPSHQRGFKLLAFQKKLGHLINARCVIHQPKRYLDYLASLASCDFSLGTFPFGGTNTNIDAILLELPKIYISGREDLASFTDLNDFNNISHSEGFRVGTELEMVAQAIIWAHNPDELKKAKGYMTKVRHDLIQQFNSDKPDFSFVRAIEWALATTQ